MSILELLRSTLAVVLAGGEGQRLYPLTRDRAKPAVPFGAVYRIIDFTLSNCLNSGIRRISLLTQYKSLSLDRHIRLGWSIFNPEIGEYIQVIPPQQRTGSRWYAGTADAIFQNLYTLEQVRPRFTLVLSGDHVYRMNYAEMLTTHVDKQADLTIAFIEVPAEEARRLGVAKVDTDGRVVDFVEKVSEPPEIPGKAGFCLASMGIYVFDTKMLARRVSEDARRAEGEHDFGKNVIPWMVQNGDMVFAHRFAGVPACEKPYWRDIGVIDAYYEANMDLVAEVPLLDLYDDRWPIRTYHEQVPPSKVVKGASGKQGDIRSSLVAEGCIISGGLIEHSLASSSVYIGDGAIVRNSILMEGVQVQRGALVENAILDKGVVVPEEVDLRATGDSLPKSEKDVVIVPKGTPAELFGK